MFRRPLRRLLLTLLAAGAIGALLVLPSAAASGPPLRAEPTGGKPPPPKDRWPEGAVDITTVSNGCGPGGANTAPHWSGKDRQTYTTDSGAAVTVSFRDACDLHDAAYSGALVWDNINGGWVDFSEPRWTKEAINEKFKHDLQRLCFRAFPDAAGMGAEKALLKCLTGNAIISSTTWGALSYYEVVTSFVGANPRERIKLSGEWQNPSPGFPPCDVGAHPWAITQVGRVVTAQWENGTAGGSVGRFEGTFITGDRLGDDRVEGTYTIEEGGRVVAKGTVAFSVRSDKSLDFSGSGVMGSGRMVLVKRATQAAAARCRAPRPAPPPPAGAFLLDSSLTQITNTHPQELTIDPVGETGELDHTGPNGGAGNGGDWKIHYSWKVPRTLIAGKTASITLGDTISDVNPNQPLSDSINALAPDFAQQLIVHYPPSGPSSQTYAYKLAADQAGAKEITITIGFTSSTVVYHYRHAGK